MSKARLIDGTGRTDPLVLFRDDFQSLKGVARDRGFSFPDLLGVYLALRFGAGQTPPTPLAIAEDLGISVDQVRGAFRLLAEGGWRAEFEGDVYLVRPGQVPTRSVLPPAPATDLDHLLAIYEKVAGRAVNRAEVERKLTLLGGGAVVTLGPSAELATRLFVSAFPEGAFFGLVEALAICGKEIERAAFVWQELGTPELGAAGQLALRMQSAYAAYIDAKPNAGDFYRILIAAMEGVSVDDFRGHLRKNTPLEACIREAISYSRRKGTSSNSLINAYASTN